uniref:Uncharacterized protein n=1 Tax=Ditylenchus dipsaci TaxID=166011 RepID=A0A915DTX8_9BILA
MDQVYGPYTKVWQPRAFRQKSSIPQNPASSRYLWSDAYGVCNYLTLHQQTGSQEALEQAKILIDTVHNILGRTRNGLSRLGDSTDEHPLRGGLRIGKEQDEGRGMSEDGQYYHYLTKWLFALNRMSLVSKDPRYNQWAIEMVQSIHFKFCSKDMRRMYWKMSIDLSHPLIPSEGGLDTYDGLTMYMLLQETAKMFHRYNQMTHGQQVVWSKNNLQPEIDHMKHLVDARYQSYTTNDCLDAGEALWLASLYSQLDYARHLKAQASKAVELLWKHGEFQGSVNQRLGFREFGTTIGVQMHNDLMAVWQERVNFLHQFWGSYLQVRDNDITPIMFCSSLIPGVLRAENLK